MEGMEGVKEREIGGEKKKKVGNPKLRDLWTVFCMVRIWDA